MRIVIVGGVAGGASAAARARRVNSEAEIIILEKGPTVSFANCGLPYHLGGEIPSRDKLLVATADLFWRRFRIEVRTNHEVVRIDRNSKLIEYRVPSSSELSTMEYDKLILATGSKPLTPSLMEPLPDNAFHLWTLEHMDRIMEFIRQRSPSHAVVIGGGFVGLEVVEQLHRLGLKVSLLQNSNQVLRQLDLEMARIVEKHLASQGVSLLLNADIVELKREGDRIQQIQLADGRTVTADLVIVGIGVQPRTELAVESGLAIGPSRGVAVNAWMQTSDPSIYAVGDMVESFHGVTHRPVRIPLAGPANRGGRIAGQHAATGKADPVGELLGTSIVRVFDVTAACTGLNESMLKAERIAYRSAIIQAANHATYFPGAQSMTLKLLYAPSDGKILGAQAVGGEGVDKRIDVIATAIHFGATVRQLAQLDLAYAPPYGSAKDPVHLVAFTACNDLDAHPHLMPPDSDLRGFQVVDVRTSAEQEKLPLDLDEPAAQIEIDELGSRWNELDPSIPTVVVCHSGKRAHVGACLLRSKGFASVFNLSGGMSIRSLVSPQMSTQEAR
jgi:NADPH-dependent 2,4-dienoyl-CoA reductase/sulfur reductase-like enzyme/rhodanese-related sulfurtransferase